MRYKCKVISPKVDVHWLRWMGRSVVPHGRLWRATIVTTHTTRVLRQSRTKNIKIFHRVTIHSHMWSRLHRKRRHNVAIEDMGEHLFYLTYINVDSTSQNSRTMQRALSQFDLILTVVVCSLANIRTPCGKNTHITHVHNVSVAILAKSATLCNLCIILWLMGKCSQKPLPSTLIKSHSSANANGCWWCKLLRLCCVVRKRSHQGIILILVATLREVDGTLSFSLMPGYIKCKLRAPHVCTVVKQLYFAQLIVIQTLVHILCDLLCILNQTINAPSNLSLYFSDLSDSNYNNINVEPIKHSLSLFMFILLQNATIRNNYSTCSLCSWKLTITLWVATGVKLKDKTN